MDRTKEYHALSEDFNDADYERMPGMREWINEVKQIFSSFKEEQQCLDMVRMIAQEHGYNFRENMD